MFSQHIDEAVEVSEKTLTDESKERSIFDFRLLYIRLNLTDGHTHLRSRSTQFIGGYVKYFSCHIILESTKMTI